MDKLFDRRTVVRSGAAGLLALAADGGPARAASLKLGPPKPFSFDMLKAEAARLVALPYRPPPRPASAIVERIDYDAAAAIKFDVDQALFLDRSLRFPVSFFHLGKFFPKAVAMHVVDGGTARPIVYEQSYFVMPADSPALELPPGVGFAGFRVHEPRDGTLDWKLWDWVAFLGAAYFRAIGELHQFGLSARAVALDVGQADKAEEFPDFTEIYLEQTAESDSVTACALMESPSLVGACRFVMHRDAGVTMDVEQSLHLRADVARFGLAPLTSMYWFSETRKPTAVDWRPEVHDSDGLAMWAGSGERIWRPLNNPAKVTVSNFLDEAPRGFGLSQRDRSFDHYLDGVRYDRRPTAWVEPIGSWGKGAVQLVELPTGDEIEDNITVMWVPERAARAGSRFDFAYRLFWQDDEPNRPDLAHCIATRLGNGGQPGLPRPQGVRKFMVEFMGKALADLPFGTLPEPVLYASRGTFSYVFTEAVPDDVPGHWRAQFDLTAAGTDPVEVRLFLRAGDKILSETWAYQLLPV